MTGNTANARPRALLFGAVLLALAVACGGCHKTASDEQHYHLQGKVVSVNQREGYVTVDAGDIPGYMAAMTMPYTVHDPKDLTALSPGDEIAADLAIIKGVPELQKIVVTKKAAADQPPAQK